MKTTAIKCNKSGEVISNGYVVMGGEVYYEYEHDAYRYLLEALSEYLIEDVDGEYRYAKDMDPQSFIDYCYDENYLYWEDWSE